MRDSSHYAIKPGLTLVVQRIQRAHSFLSEILTESHLTLQIIVRDSVPDSGVACFKLSAFATRDDSLVAAEASLVSDSNVSITNCKIQSGIRI